MCLVPVLHAGAFPSSFVLACQGLLFMENNMLMIIHLLVKKQTLFEQKHACSPIHADQQAFPSHFALGSSGFSKPLPLQAFSSLLCAAFPSLLGFKGLFQTHLQVVLFQAPLPCLTWWFASAGMHPLLQQRFHTHHQSNHGLLA